MTVSEKTFLQLAFEDPDGLWELHCGRLHSKVDDSMTAWHGDLMFELALRLRLQLPRSQYRIRVNAGYLKRSDHDYYVPDVLVIPADLERAQRDNALHVEMYTEPLPLVVEVWSRSTGSVDREEKLPEYRRRGDLEIWLLHPYERTLTTWVRQSDGEYVDTTYRSGVVRLSHLPGVAVDLDALFATQD